MIKENYNICDIIRLSVWIGFIDLLFNNDYVVIIILCYFVY